MASGSLPAARAQVFANSAGVRSYVVEQLRLDLIGPGPADTSLHAEALTQAPSRWYMTGFIVPRDAPEEQRAGDAAAEGDLDSGDDSGGTDDSAAPDPASARRSWRPSSMGLSFLLEGRTASIEVEVTWGDYRWVGRPNEQRATEDREAEGAAATAGRPEWHRNHRVEKIPLFVDTNGRSDHPVPKSNGLELSMLVRPTTLLTENGNKPAKAISLFLVNRRKPVEELGRADEAFAFQVQLAVETADGFLPRADLRGLESDDWDERLGDLHYRDVCDYAVGHNVAAEWVLAEGVSRRVLSACMPVTAVPRVVPNLDISNFELGMETLGRLADASEAKAKLSGVITAYRDWISQQRAVIGQLALKRQEVARTLLDEATAAANRIADGIASLGQPEVLEAFRIANRAIARAARQREGQIRGVAPKDAPVPRWRPFQLAFILLNLRGLAEPTHAEREAVDLLFFPTGGGKTEAYLGLAAFAIAYRRLTNTGLTGAGLSVLMRYTLRLLTLDQLGRASAVICALELERLADSGSPKKLGDWPIEIGLWVGRGATPNRMGYEGYNDSRHVTARWKVINYKRKSNRPLPVPIRSCPWCGTSFDRDSFRLVDASGKADERQPVNLELRCVNRDCEFHLSRKALPVLTVDEPIYRRLPAFLIATVDKFAGMPWTGEIAAFCGGANRGDGTRFFGAATPVGGVPLSKPLLPPDLVIQDELHLISGPLGTMVGLYEAALDRLCWREVDGMRIRPKIVVSTATVRKAERQIRALFDRRDTRIFPPPGPNRNDSFFAHTLGIDDPGARQYLGLAVPGGSPKVLFLRSLVSLMAIAETAWEQNKPDDKNPADPYMTLVSYFNALRELGGARRIVEGEVGPRLLTYNRRLRAGETVRFSARDIKYDVMELTSRVPTDAVADAKRRLAGAFKGRKDKDSVDVALATNMISVGLDITRLGLMVVSGQPKTAAEYIQATSRVGREATKPGLVVALLNINKPRDRSHYERFVAWHSAFYRSVEATSVTPFSPRALDRGLAAIAVGLGRLGLADFTPSKGAKLAQSKRGDLNMVADVLAARAGGHDSKLSAAEQTALADRIRLRVTDILDDWAKISNEAGQAGVELGYQRETGVAAYLLREMLDKEPLPPFKRKFRAPRSLRDVEPPVLIKLESPSGQPVPE
jgi:hypothetical protein